MMAENDGWTEVLSRNGKKEKRRQENTAGEAQAALDRIRPFRFMDLPTAERSLWHCSRIGSEANMLRNPGHGISYMLCPA